MKCGTNCNYIGYCWLVINDKFRQKRKSVKETIIYFTKYVFHVKHTKYFSLNITHLCLNFYLDCNKKSCGRQFLSLSITCIPPLNNTAFLFNLMV